MLNNYALFFLVFYDHFNNLVIPYVHVFLIPEHFQHTWVSYFTSYIKCVTFFVIGLSFSDTRFFISQRAACNSANICTNFARADWSSRIVCTCRSKATLFYPCIDSTSLDLPFIFCKSITIDTRAVKRSASRDVKPFLLSRVRFACQDCSVHALRVFRARDRASCNTVHAGTCCNKRHASNDNHEP